jgi:hypothetical protein
VDRKRGSSRREKELVLTTQPLVLNKRMKNDSQANLTEGRAIQVASETGSGSPQCSEGVGGEIGPTKRARIENSKQLIATPLGDERRWVEGYEGLYAVDIDGFVWNAQFSKNGWNKLSGTVHSKGYIIVDFRVLGFRKAFFVHRLIASAFLPNPDCLPCVNHKDLNKKNNSVGNLEWCTHSQNSFHATVAGAIPSGEQSPASKLTLLQVTEIRRLCIEGSKSLVSIGKEFGICSAHVARIRDKQRWK